MRLAVLLDVKGKLALCLPPALALAPELGRGGSESSVLLVFRRRRGADAARGNTGHMCRVWLLGAHWTVSDRFRSAWCLHAGFECTFHRSISDLSSRSAIQVSFATQPSYQGLLSPLHRDCATAASTLPRMLEGLGARSEIGGYQVTFALVPLRQHVDSCLAVSTGMMGE
jgi:hypothetical protein